MIILLDLLSDSGQNEIFFVKIKTRVQFRQDQTESYPPCTQAKKLVAVNSKVIAVYIRLWKLCKTALHVDTVNNIHDFSLQLHICKYSIKKIISCGSLNISTNFVYKTGHILELYSVLAQVPFDISNTKLDI